MSRILNCTPYRILLPDIVRGEGINVFDRSGKRYMDLESGVWCTSLGHSHVQINNVLKNQVDRITHSGFCFSNGIVEDSAEKLLELAKIKGGKCVFLCSGSEAIEIGRQISRRITGLRISMTLHDSYLGSYSSVTDRHQGWFLFDWRECSNCRYNDDCRKDCWKLKEIPESISEFIFEPGSASGFVRFPPESMIRNLIERVAENGGKIIANEVTTGIGRTGTWFGFEHYRIVPDMIAIGKGLGNGYPVSAILINEKTAVEAESSGFRYMQSHQNDPLGASIAKQVVEIIERDNLLTNAAENGKFLVEQLKGSVGDGIITAVRGRGLMIGVDLNSRETGDRIFEKLLEEGFIVCNRGSLFRIDPPLNVRREELERFLSCFFTILGDFL